MIFQFRRGTSEKQSSILLSKETLNKIDNNYTGGGFRNLSRLKASLLYIRWRTSTIPNKHGGDNHSIEAYYCFNSTDLAITWGTTELTKILL